jgi:hypothetical protein
MTARQNRAFVVLNMPTRVNDFIGVARAVFAASTSNPLLSHPNPWVSKLGATITALGDAQTDTLTHTRGTAPARDESLSACRAALRALRAHVQEQADANPEQAGTVITSSGMSLRRASTRAKAPFTATPGRVSGTMILEVRAAAKRAAYEWQWRVRDTTRWTNAPNTLQAKITITGLPIGEYVDFRFRPATKTGEGDWSDPITVLVN